MDEDRRPAPTPSFPRRPNQFQNDPTAPGRNSLQPQYIAPPGDFNGGRAGFDGEVKAAEPAVPHPPQPKAPPVGVPPKVQQKPQLGRAGQKAQPAPAADGARPAGNAPDAAKAPTPVPERDERTPQEILGIEGVPEKPAAKTPEQRQAAKYQQVQSWHMALAKAARNGHADREALSHAQKLFTLKNSVAAAKAAALQNPDDAASQEAYKNAARHLMAQIDYVHERYARNSPADKHLNEAEIDNLNELSRMQPVRKQRQGLPVRYQSSYLMVSSNVRDSDKTRNTAHYKDPMNFNSALNATTSGRHQTGADNAANLIHSITQVKPIVQHGVGDWADGGENTTVHELPGAVPHEKLREAAANVGYTHAQKSVLIFTPHNDGTHLFHTVQVPKMHPEMLRKSLDEHGVAFRTIVPGKTHDTLHVYDGDGGTIKNLQRWSQQHGAKMHTQRGTGEFIADLYNAEKDYTPGRMASKKVYMDIDPTLRPGSGRPYETRQVFTQKNFTRSRVRYAAEHAQHDARRLAGGDVSAGSMEVMQRYLTDLSKHDPDKLSKMLDTNQVGDRGKHYEWLDSLGESTRAMLQHLAGQKPDIGGGAPGGKQMPSSIAKLAKSILTNPDSYRRNLRDLHHQLIDAGLYGSGSKPVWPDKERLLEVAGKLKGTGRIGELDQYLQSVHKNHPMVDLEESQSPAPAEQKQEQQHPCHNCSGGMQEQVARLEARGIKLRFEGDMRHMERGQKAAECE